MRQAPNAEMWETVYKSFQQINFSAFDYDTVKHALVEHIKQYYSENFNDYIEDDEFIMLIETFAYICELYVYRLDMNAHENFIGTAQRKQSVLRLVQLISYTPSRNLPGRGLVKITSVSTTEDVFDARGTNLANVTVNWNDQNNPYWKEQFVLIMDRIMERELGTVLPTERVQVDDVLFEQYALKNIPLSNGVIKYSASVNGQTYPMELVPSVLDALGPVERRPTRDSKMTVLYAYDGIGDSSDATGYFFFTKQGSLQRLTRSYDGVTPFMTDTIDVPNINNTDVWVNNVDPDTGVILQDRVYDATGRSLGVTGEWVSVDLANLQNIAFNTNQKRNKFQIETLEEDKIKLVFGDGEFADIPQGTFDIWVRSSANDDILIPRSSLRDKQVSLNYSGADGITHSASFTINAINVISNSAPSETIDSIRQNAPLVYQTQNRMVNGADYNNYPLKDSSILKVRTVNRSFAGHSRNITFEDSTGTYKDVNLYGEGLRVFYRDSSNIITGTADQNVRQFIINTFQPLLSSPSVSIYHETHDLPAPNNTFTEDEIDGIEAVITQVESNNGLGYPITTSFIPANTYARVYIHFEPDVVASSPTALDASGTQYGITITYTLSGVTTVKDVIFSSVHVPSIQTLVDKINNDMVTAGLGIEASVDRGSILIESTDPLLTFIDVLDGATNVPGTTPLIQALGQAPIAGRTVSIDPAVLPTATLPEWRAFPSNVINPFLETFTLDDDSVRTIAYNETNIVAESDTIDFWYNNRGSQVINPLTRQTTLDRITVLGTNIDTSRTGIIGSDVNLIVVDNPNYDAGTDIGMKNLGRVYVTTQDINGDFKPDGINLPSLIGLSVDIDEYPTALDSSVAGNNIWDLTKTPIGLSVVGVDELSLEFNGSSIDFFFCDETGTEVVDSVETAYISVPDTYPSFDISKQEYVYFEVVSGVEQYLPATTDVKRRWLSDTNVIRHGGREGLFFVWNHKSTDFNLVDPSPTNIHDMFVMTNGYYKQYVDYVINGSSEPTKPSSTTLKNTYSDILSAEMLSDTVVMKHASFKTLFGSKAAPELQAYFKVVKSANPVRTDNEIINEIVDITRQFFNPKYWEMGETFYFEELASTIQGKLYTDVKSIVLVPRYPGLSFGNLYEIHADNIELFYPDITLSDIKFVETLSATELNFS